MPETTADTELFSIKLTGAEEPEPEKKPPWMLYLIAAGIAAALLG